MPKNSVKGIKQDEKKILDELRKNANKSANDIAETCGFSRQKVWRVINNLEKNHTIWGYTAVVDVEKLDKKGYIILFKRSNKPILKEILNKVEKRVLANRVKQRGIEFIHSIYLNGRYDYMICFNANNIIDAKGVVEELNTQYEGYMSEIILLENMFTAVNCGVTNPDIKKLKDFFKV